MNIEQANAIPLPEILHKLGYQSVKQNANDIWYLSPFRQEKTASFHINTKSNVWYDFGMAKGGDVIAFVCAYLKENGEDSNVSDALRWVKNMSFSKPDVSSFLRENFEKTSSLELLKVTPIENSALLGLDC